LEAYFFVVTLTTTREVRVLNVSTQVPTDTAQPDEITNATPTNTSQPKIIPTATPVDVLTDMPNTEIPLPASTDTSCIPINTTSERGVVTRIADGDTIEVRLEDGATYRVRYIGFDTPERERPLSDEAAQANSKLVLNKEILLIQDVSEVDDFDRLLRYIIVDDIFVNLELVRLGLAVAESYPPDTACDSALLSAQEEAQNAHLGLWVPTQTPEPSDPVVVIMTVNKRDEYVDIKNS